MMTFDICQLLPDFILGDKNGFALAKALEAGLQMFCKIILAGIGVTLDVEKMPVWRLDEMAWELGCLYDYGASIENKRAWIQDAVPLYASYGTVEAIYKYLRGYFDRVEVEENWQYHGEPYHFRVSVEGEWTDAKEQWAKKAVGEIKNIRSILDDISIGGSAAVKILCETDWRRIIYEMTSGDWLTGTMPQENTVSAQASAAATALADGAGTVFSYPLCGEE